MTGERRARPEPGPARIIGYAERLLRAAGEIATEVSIEGSTGPNAPAVMAEFVAVGFYLMWNTLCLAYFEAEADSTMDRVLNQVLLQLGNLKSSPGGEHDRTKQFIVKRVEDYESAGGANSVIDRFAGFLNAAWADIARAGGRERLLENFYKRIDPNVYLLL